MIPLLLGGEMPHWQDPSPVRGEALSDLLTAAQGHTLIAGPHDASLIDRVTAGRITVLVRGVPDAERLAARYASHPGVEVCCGSLEKLAAVPAYDTVIALDGLDRVTSTESDGPTWDDSLAVLLAVLRPGGRLLLGCENPSGLHRLLALGTEPGDEDWSAPAFDDPSRPATLTALTDRLTAAGLSVLHDYAAFPDPRAPRALISPALFHDPHLTGFLAGALRRAGLPSTPILADPRPLLVQTLASASTTVLAPAWFVAASRAGSVSLPAAILTSPAEETHRVTQAAHGWTRVSSSTGPSAAPSRGPFSVPDGRNLLEALLAAARGQDLAALRTLLAAWQGGQFAGTGAEALVVDAEGRLFDLGIGPAADPGQALRDFIDAAPEDLADLIEAMAGIEATPAATAARPDPAAPVRPGPAALREVTAERDRLARELAETRERAAWYEQRLAARDRELARAYRIIAVLKGTVPGRAATAVRGALRTGRRAARTALSQIRKP
ncbi:hypothetical protein ACTI_40330 [Actinoplanes sp. OR16]|uniref:hypothetical protein n=1 Tax=Actinoplanes sp. OR16 TaxID=946334 RepID=UPI000F707D4A|nr:hypothetical protein [Actinoplanes sp. OR16]BBH67348.1 hypothetical protein ACTI_40330 [Actinoplanes sp. OR16]